MGQLINSDRVEFAGDAWTKNQPVITTTTATVKDFKLLNRNLQECPVQSGSKKLTKAIKMVKKNNSNSYSFVETIINPDHLNEWLSKK